MRHLNRNAKLGRKGDHRNAMLANLVCSLIRHKRVTTTLAKAKAAKPVAEKLVTMGKKGGLHHRRLATARLRYEDRKMHPTKEANQKFWQNDVIRILFDEIAPGMKDRNGGYTRIVKLGHRRGDAAQTAILEWVEYVGATVEETAESATADAKEDSAPVEGVESEKKDS